MTVDVRPRTHGGVRSLGEVVTAVSAFGSLSRGGPSAEQGAGGRAWYLTGSPSMVKLGSRLIDTATPLWGLSRAEWMRDNVPMSAVVDDEASKRGDITYLSQKSRLRMQQRVCSLDYSPLFAGGRLLPKMVTLTMPHDWERFAPDARAFKRKLVDVGLKQVFRRHWGYDLEAVWKLEFQERKQCRRDGCHDPQAPHLHILMAPPSGLCPQTGETFEQWLRSVWSKACSDERTTFSELQDHRAKGIHIDDTYGITGTDSKRIGDYFAKHGLFSDKEYQNSPPKAWMGDDGQIKPGRYWGYWGLSVAEHSEVLGTVSELRHVPKVRPGRAAFADPGEPVMQHNRMPNTAEFADPIPGKNDYVSTAEGDTPVEVHIARILRRWAKANGKHKKVRLTVPDARHEHDPGVITVGGKLIDTATGQILERRLSLWKGPFRGRGAGFLLVNDGVHFMEQLHRAVTPPLPSSVPLGESVAMAHAIAQKRIDERRRARDEYTAALGIVTLAA